MKNFLNNEDLLNCKYEGVETGWTLEREKLPEEIKTEQGLLYYKMGVGYVIIKLNGEEILWNDSIKLIDYLKQNGIDYRNEKVKIEDEEWNTEKEKNHKEYEETQRKAKEEFNKYNPEVPYGYFKCWECGSIEPISKRLDDGTCGC